MAAQNAIVTRVTGKAWLRAEDGSLTELAAGAKVPAGAQIVTATGSTVELAIPGQPPLLIGADRTLTLTGEVFEPADPGDARVARPTGPDSERLLGKLAAPSGRTDDGERMEYGSQGGDGGSGFVRLLRIVEPTVPLALDYPRPADGRPELPHYPGGYPVASGANTPPSAVTPPQGPLGSQTHDDGQTIAPIDVRPYFTDLDGDRLTYTALGLPPGLSMDPSTGIISGTIDASGSTGGQARDGHYVVAILVRDPSGGTAYITIDWTVDNPPPVAADDLAATTADQNATGNVLTGPGQDIDPDNDPLTVTHIGNGIDTVTAGQTIAGSNGGTFVIHPDGSYTFVPGNDFDALRAGDPPVDTHVTYTISDGEGGTSTATLTVTVGGLDDAPVFSGQDTGAVTEDASTPTLTDTGRLIVADPDNGQSAIDTAIAPVPGAGTIGNLTIGADGSWVYTVPNADVQYLKDGETRTETFTVTSVDGTTHDIVITITGTNDVPMVTDDAGFVTEDLDVAGMLATAGAVTITDPDAGEAEFDPATTAFTGSTVAGGAQLGTLVVNADGTYTYTVGNALPEVQALAVGESIVETYTVASADGTATSTITITIQGTNDVPVISGVSTGALTEDDPVTTSTGQLTVADVDASDTHTWTFKSNGTDSDTGAYGNIAVDATGQWTYTLDPAKAQALKAGETYQERFIVLVDDGHGGTDEQEIVITLAGAEDAPVFTGQDSGAVTEDASNPTLTDSSQLIVTDADAGQSAIDTGIAPVASAGALGTITIDADGNWTYSVPNADVQYLAQGETKVETFTVTSIDGTTHDIVITITGTNDVPVVTNDARTIVEDVAVSGGLLSTSGAVAITDTDAGQSSFDPATTAFTGSTVAGGSQLGSLAVNPDGTYTYTVGNTLPEVQALAVGESIVETYTVASADGTATSTITITILGTNDIPVISGIATGALTEDDLVDTATGQLTVADLDTSDTHTWTFKTSGSGAEAGAYGDIVIDATGQWTYTLDAAKAQALKAGETYQERFTVLVDDGHGGTDEREVVVTLTGKEDAPVFSGDDAGSVVEDAANPMLADSGRLIVTDADAGQSAIDTAIAPVPSAGALGSITIDADGNWTYSVPNAAVQYLTQGETKIETFTVTSIDGTTHDIVITITGTNDVPVVTNDARTIVEDVAVSGGLLSTSGAVTITDTDAGQSSFDPATTAFTSSTVAGGSQLGTLVVNPNGTYTYTVGNALPEVQALAVGESIVETYTVASADGSATSTITITILGTNDAPAISGVSTGALTEDDPITTATGQLAVADVDTSDTHTWTFKSNGTDTDTGSYGSVVIDATGQWTYTLDNTKTQGLKAGETREERFTVLVDDGHGGTDEQEIVITLTGTEDAPVFTGQDAGAVVEDAANPTLTDTGRLIVTDADAGQSAIDTTIAPIASAGALGSLAIGTDGNWTYSVPNADVQYLKAGETKTETFTVTSIDGSTHDIVITITGTEDAPVFTGQDAGAVTEDAADPTLTDSGQLIVTDADAGQSAIDTAIAPVPSAGALGTITIDANGNWSYSVPNADVQYLKAGETKTETFTVASIDGTTHDIVITITGTEDVPVFTGQDAGAVVEDAANPTLTDSGQLIVTDADAGQSAIDTAVAPIASAGALGSLAIDSDGNWTYSVPNADVQYLKAGETKTETFTVTSIDGTTHDIVITITGTEDVPVFTGQDAGAVIEDAADPTLTDSGQLIVTDADAGHSAIDTAIAPVPSAGALGSITIDADGNWTYSVPNADVQYLKAGETKTETFTVTSIDGTAHDIVITITGTEDAPVFTGQDTGAVVEDAANPTLTDSGQLIVTDADAGQSAIDTAIAPVASAGALGAITIDADGNWTYSVPNADVQYLKAGETKVETFTVTSVDGSTHDIVVTITGTEDAPVFTGRDTGAVVEDAANPTLTDSGQLIVTDADAGQSAIDTGIVPVASPGALGAITIDANGNWTYSVPNAAVQYLAQGETKIETFTVTSIDGTTHDIVITITGTNDVPAVTNDARTIVEDVAVSGGLLSTSGAVTITDLDAGEAEFDPATMVFTGSTVAGGTQLGTLVVNPNGTYTYTVGNALPEVQALAVGESIVETYTVASADGTVTSTITITILGTNDVPVISGVSTGALIEDDPITTATGQLTVADVDASDTHTWTFKSNGTDADTGAYGDIVIDATGQWTYNLDTAKAQELKAGETREERFTVLVDDGHGGTDEQEIVVTLTGTEDAPAFTGQDAGAVIEDAANPTLIDTGRLIVTDADAGQSAIDTTIAPAPSAGALGTLSIATDGTWIYTVPNADVQYLKAGETKIETFTVTSIDGTTHDIVITVTGTEDAPVFTGQDAGAVTEDAADPTLTDSGQLIVTDADAGQSAIDTAIAPVPSAGALGSITIDANGNWSYSVPNADVQYLKAGETKIETFTVTSIDGTTHDIVITITGTEDAPVFTGQDAGAVVEDAADPTLTDSGRLIVTDADAGQSAIDTAVAPVPSAGALGTITIDASGNWTYSVPNADVQYLKAGETKVETFTVTSVDGTTHDIVVTITGTEDAPVFTGQDAGAVTEDAADPTLTDSGQLIVTDADAGQSAIDTAIAPVPSAGALGSITIDANGNWTYSVPNADVQYLKAGETKTETFTVTSIDGTAHDIVITITGTEDVPVFTGQDAGAVVEDAANPTLTDSGQLIVTDADAGQSAIDTAIAPIASAGALGSIIIDANGNWTYSVPNADVQYLKTGETKVETFTVTSIDGATHDIVITITGTEDAPVFSGDDTGSVVEDAANPMLADSGRLIVTDADAGQSAIDTAVAPVASPGALGSITIDANGNWTYSVPNAAVQYLTQGETKTETFTVTSIDGTTHDIVITITGTNDVPVVSNDARTIVEDVAVSGGLLSTSGAVTITDTDAGQSSFDPATTAFTNSTVAGGGQLGTLVVNANGTYTYTVGNALPEVQALAVGESIVETYTVASADGTATSTITITILGTNDIPVISGVSTGALTEDDLVDTATGQLTVADADTSDTHTWTFKSNGTDTDAGTYGDITIDATGQWTYTLDNTKTQGLKAGETREERFTVLVDDGHGGTDEQEIVVTITGTNDLPVVTDDAGSVTEDVGVSATGMLATAGAVTITDLDAGEARFDPATTAFTGSTVAGGAQLGTLVVNADGTYTYTVGNALSEVQALAVGESIVETYTVASADGTATSTITITILGTNDIPVISGVSTGALTEDDLVDTAAGQLTVADLDTSDTHTWTFKTSGNGAEAGAYGDIVIDATGQWAYTLDPAKAQALKAGETYQERFTVLVDDGHGGTDEQEVVVTLTGTEDAPVFSGDDAGSVVEDAASPTLTDSGRLIVTDDDAGQSAVDISIAPVASTGALGSITIDADGNWTYSVSNAAVQYLTQGETKIETFTVTSIDGTTHDIVITITGTNDVPVVSNDARTIVEDIAVSGGLLSTSGAVTITDPDAGEAEFDPATTAFTSSTVAGGSQLGTLVVNPDGTYTYTIGNALSEVQALAVGESIVETYTVSSADGAAISTITITILGTNDIPVISGVSTGALTEDDLVNTATGQLTVADVDASDTHTWTFKTSGNGAEAGAYGDILIDATGQWTYTLDNAKTQGLKAGETREERFTVLVDDGHGGTDEQEIVVTITGTEDAPAFTGQDTGAVVEDAANPTLTDTGRLIVTDADAGQSAIDTTIAPIASAGALGAITIGTDGNWTYSVPNADVQYLKDGETKVETFTVTSIDGTTHDIVITITGTEDVPVFTGQDAGAVVEDAANPTLTDSGQLIVTDADAGQSAIDTGIVPVASPGALGTITIDADGNWTYSVPNADVQYLKDGETKVETFTVTSIDGSTHDVVITIIGTEDAPVFTGQDTGAVVEDAANPTLTDTGRLIVTDADAGQSAIDTGIVPVASAGALGAITIDADGNWTYSVPNADVQYLKAGETKVETFTVTSVDGSTHDIVVTITGTEDAPVFTGRDTGAVVEDAANPTLTDNGQLIVTDADAGQSAIDTAIVPVASAGALGAITIDADGNWTYSVPNADVQYLKAGETKVETFTVTSIDGTTHDIVITITGTEDAPVFNGQDTGAVVEDAANPTLTDSGQLIVTDADAGQSAIDTAIAPVPSAGSLGAITIDADGNWTYSVPNADVQYLKDGETKVETFTVTSIDGTTHDIVITITGTEDAPVFSGDDAGSVVEDAANPLLVDSGRLIVTDADAGQSAIDIGVVPVASAGALGSITIDANGNWTYSVPNAAVQYLTQDETKIETFTVTSIDGTAHDIVITITGTNDVPVVTNDARTIVEDVAVSGGLLSTSGAVTITDTDAGQSSFDPATTTFTGSTVTGGSQLGTLIVNTNGTYTYTVGNALPEVQALAVGESIIETYTVASADGSATSTITITILGTNDIPVISGVSTGALTEDDLVNTATGQLTVADVDTSDTHTWTFRTSGNGAETGAYGDIVIDAAGQWTYTLDNTKTQALKAGETREERFTVLVDDGHGGTDEQEIVVTITGANDLSVVTDDAGSVTEDVGVSATGMLATAGAVTITDLDAGEAGFDPATTAFTSSTVAGGSQLGTLIVNPNGTYTYTVNNALPEVQALAVGESIVETYTVASTDGSATSTIIITILGTNDLPVISGIATGALTEDDAVDTAIGQLTVADVDASDTHTWTFKSNGTDSEAGTYGDIVIDATGQWTYTLDASKAQALKAGETYQERFTVLVDDGHGGTDEQEVVVTLTGTEDAPVFTGQDTGAVTEDATNPTLTDSGRLIVTDDDAGQSAIDIGVAPVASAGTLGSITIDTNGNWTYSVSNAAVQYLAQDETKIETFTVTSIDGTTHDIVITITGTNDVPVVSNDARTIVEDVAVSGGLLSTSGAVTITDTDAGQSSFDPATTAFTSSTVAGGSQLGSLVVNANGTYTYTVGNALPEVQALAVGESIVETYTVASADGSATSTITITILGTNDAPAISGISTGALTEDDPVTTATGQLAVTDVDTSDTHTWTFKSNGTDSDTGAYGSIAIDATGQWTYTLDNAKTQALKAGETREERFTVLVDDGHGGTDEQEIVVTITGTNDLPAFSGDDAGSVIEDAANPTLTDTGRLIVTDDDTGQSAIDTAIAPVPSAGALGAITIDANGNWTYSVPNADVQYLKAGETKAEIFTVTSIDGTTHDIVITITGTEDAPVFSGDDAGSVVEDAANPTLTDSGRLIVTDADAGQSAIDTAVAPIPSGGALGAITIDADGNWTYSVPNADVQYLKAGETKTETFTVTSIDGSTHDIVITITGTNDVPAVTDGTGAVTEDAGVTPAGLLSTSGSVTVNDPDAGQSAFDPATLAFTGTTLGGGGQLGILTVNANGTYTYNVRNDLPPVQHLAVNETIVETYTVTSADGTATSTITITIHGTNDDPVLSGDSSGTLLEDGPTDQVSGNLQIADADTSDTHTLSIPTDQQAQYGTATVTPAGTWTYVLNNADPAVQALALGETMTDTFTVLVDDNHGGTDTQLVTITLYGTNDTPVAIADAGTVKESGVRNGGNTAEAGTGSVTANVLANDTDVDHGSVLNVTGLVYDGSPYALGSAITTVYGTLTLAANGQYTYTLDNNRAATQALPQGTSATETFTYTIADQYGASSTANLVITVQGTNDVPVITSAAEDAQGAVVEANAGSAGTSAATGTLTSTDVDTGHTATWSMQSTNGTYGTISIDAATGTWTYTLDNTRTATQELQTGQTETETFTARVTDEHGAFSTQTITVQVSGSNDPVTAVDDTRTLSEDPAGGQVTGNVFANDLDVDDMLSLVEFQVAGDPATYGPGDTATIAGVGTISIALDGAYTFAPLADYAGSVPVITYTVEESRAGGVSDTATLTLTITPVADAPELGAAPAPFTPEDTAVALGLHAPSLTDTVAGGGSYPERLGAITLTGVPDGAQLNYGAASQTATGGAIVIILTDLEADDKLLADVRTANPGAWLMTSAEYEAMTITPPAHSGANIGLTVSVTSYEVDGSGTPLADIDGATSTQAVAVDVRAVTDPVGLQISSTDGGTLGSTATVSIDEDATVNLKTLLAATFNDLDGSEVRSFTITNGSGHAIVLNGTTIGAGGSMTVAAPGMATSASGLPDLNIGGVRDFSGQLHGITITLNAKDTDGDSPSASPGQPNAPLEQTASVTLDLDVQAVVDNATSPAINGTEDTPILFLADFALGDSDGSETLTGLVIQGLPAGWQLFASAGSATPLFTGDGVASYTVDAGDLDSGSATAAFRDYVLLPPPHSSADIQVTVQASIHDDAVNTVSASGTKTVTIPITVAPAAEIVGNDSDGDGNPDLTMTLGHTYGAGVSGTEDQWFALNQDGFDLKAGWSNQDGDEAVYALLTPVLVTGVSGEQAIGAEFRYSTDGGISWITLAYDGDPVEIPMAYLDTVQFLGPDNVAGVFRIDVQARTVDTDPDPAGGSDTQTSGTATLGNIVLAPEADQAAVSATVQPGREDQDIPLAVRPTSSDPNETFNVTFSGLPPGAKLFYGGVEQTLAGGSVTIDGFDPLTSLAVRAPENSNDNFDIGISVVTVDTVNGATSISGSPTTLTLPVMVKGVADAPDVIMRQDDPDIAPEDLPFTEQQFETQGIALKDLITHAALTDTDGSETLTFRITGLDPAFAIEGATFMGGSGLTREWVVTMSQLQGAAKLVGPEHFSGTVTGSLYAISTENDGDSHTSADLGLVAVVTPSPESDMTITSQVQEDTYSKVAFTISNNHGDADEALTKVWIKVADVDGNPNYSLHLGDGGPDLASASLAIVVKDGEDYYELSGAQIDDIYALTLANVAHNTPSAPAMEFEVKYEITDYSNDGTTGPVTMEKDSSHSLHVAPVTDPVSLDATGMGGTSGTVSQDGGIFSYMAHEGSSFHFGIDIGKVPDALAGQPDYDGSEQLTRILVEGVPSGVVVEGLEIGGVTIEASFIGGNEWLIVVPDAAYSRFDGVIAGQVIFTIHGARVEDLADAPIQVTVVTQDAGTSGAQAEERASVSFLLSTDFAGQGDSDFVEILKWEQNTAFSAGEDSAYTLGDAMTAQIDDHGVAGSGFAIVLEDLPPGTVVTGMTLTYIGGKEVWTASGTGGNAELQALMDSITVQPPADWNDNNHPDGLPYTARLTTFSSVGANDVETLQVAQPVVPASDLPEISVTSTAADPDGTPTPDAPLEGKPVAIAIDLSNSADGSFAVMEGKLYLQLTETDLNGGRLEDANGPLALQPVAAGAIPGLPAGQYYVVDLADATLPLQLTYFPSAGDAYRSGSITVNSWVQSEEQNAPQPVTAHGSTTIDLALVNNGYDIGIGLGGVVTGIEHANSSTTGMIELDVSGTGLVDNDGSERASFAVLRNLPNGFLVYTGDDASSATLAMADNAGSQGGTNSWVLPLQADGSLPNYVAILPPANWSGTISGLELSVLSGETSLSEQREDTTSFDLVVQAQADGLLSMTPTASSGREDGIVALNLNALMADSEAVSLTGLPADSSVESMTVRLTGVGAHAAFYVNDDGAQVLVSDPGNTLGITVTETAPGIYEIAGLTQAQANNLGLLQAAGAAAPTVQVEAWTVESDGGDTSAITSGTLELSIRDVPATVGNDVLLYDGLPLNGKGGDDTVWLRYGEDIDFDQSNMLQNIETIDLTRPGFDHVLSNLSAQDVLTMTDTRRVLTINADNGDDVSFKPGESWTLDGAASVPGYDVYVNTVDAGVRVEVRITSGQFALDDLLDGPNPTVMGFSFNAAPPAGSDPAVLDALSAPPQNPALDEFLQNRVQPDL
ncbi:Putative mono-oxygenase ydhR [Pigmentiphaga humi]|uniref:Mono-oxygenase ydhR n=1 Tax=Pigmentiphaga humi TaxID=2478468 RepID=A0A3P4B093_9BURK|nr:VCBS domain-containing protein [Pigmentiphaga humi]VCU69261.1 Putative mono-oxygenase ydhR [Pigmentiphaga humi]